MEIRDVSFSTIMEMPSPLAATSSKGTSFSPLANILCAVLENP